MATMNTAKLSGNILIAQMSGDRPATITKVFSNTAVEVCAFMPLPEAIKVVTIHESRAAAITAGQRGTGWHGYWPGKV
jgi:hypothetical protein